MSKTAGSLSIYKNDDAKRVRGDYYLIKGDTTAAMQEFNTIKTKDWIDWRSIGFSAVSLKDSSLAEISIDKAVELGATEPNIRELRKEVAYLIGDFETAMSAIDSGEGAEYNKIILLYKTAKYDDVVISVNRVIGGYKGEDRRELLLVAGNSSIELKQWSDVIGYFSLLSKEFPAGSWLYNIAVAHYNLTDIESSYSYYQKARALDPTIKSIDIEKRYNDFVEENRVKTAADSTVVMESADSLYNLALKYHREGALDSAKQLYLNVVDQDGRHYRAWNNLGALYGAAGDIDEAIDAYENAVSRRGDIVDGYLNLVNLYIAIEELDKADRWCKKGLKRHNGNARLLAFERQIVALRK